MGWDGHVLSVWGPGFEHRDLRLPLVGDYQPRNAALAVAAAHLLDVREDAAFREGLASTRWPGRLQVISERPRVILDGGHNPAAMVKAGATLRGLIGSPAFVGAVAEASRAGPVPGPRALRPLHA